MYELTCPSCAKKASFPFVRVGAAVVCQDCNHQYTVKPAHVHRLVTPPPAVDGQVNPLIVAPPLIRVAAPKPQPATPPLTAPPSPSPQASNPSTVGVPSKPRSQQEPVLKDLTNDEARPAPSVAAMIASHKRHRRFIAIARVAGIPVGAVALIAAMVLLAGLFGKPGAGPDDVHGGDEAADRDDGSQTDVVHADLPTLLSSFVEQSGWEAVKLLPDFRRRQGAFTLLGEGILVRGDERIFSAELVCDSEDLIEHATLYLNLVDDTEQVFAQKRLPLLLLSANNARMIRTPIPPSTYDRMVAVSWRVEVKRRMPSGVPMGEIWWEGFGQAEYAAVRIAATNPLDAPVRDVAVAVVAVNSRGDEVAWWRAQWHDEVEPRRRIEFIVPTPVDPAWDVTQWRVMAAATPVAPNQGSPHAERPADQAGF